MLDLSIKKLLVFIIKKISILLVSVIALMLLAALLLQLKRPSYDRNFQVGLDVIPEVAVSGDLVSIKNIRDFDYEDGVEIPQYLDEQIYDLSEVETLWLFVEPFDKNPAIAHTFFSFGFEDGEYLSFSIEARKEVGEKYDAKLGVLRNYELGYFFGTEADFVGRRAYFLDHTVSMYKVDIEKRGVRGLLESILEETNSLETNPKFYNTLLSNCTNNLARHATEAGTPISIWRRGVITPGYAPELLYDYEFIDTDISLEEHIRQADITTKAREINRSDYSDFIRS